MLDKKTDWRKHFKEKLLSVNEKRVLCGQ